MVDGDECRNLYVIQRFKKGIEGRRTSLALYIAKLDPTEASYTQIIRATLWSLLCTLATQQQEHLQPIKLNFNPFQLLVLPSNDNTLQIQPQVLFETDQAVSVENLYLKKRWSLVLN